MHLHNYVHVQMAVGCTYPGMGNQERIEDYNASYHYSEIPLITHTDLSYLAVACYVYVLLTTACSHDLHGPRAPMQSTRCMFHNQRWLIDCGNWASLKQVDKG